MRPTRTLFLPVILAAAAGSAAAQRSPSPAGGSSIPTPESVIGFPVGEDYKLFTYDQSIDYFKKLAAASNRVRLLTVGKTAYGKTWTAVLISSPANLARLDKIRETNMKLAHPVGLTDAQARDLARQGRAIVDISGGLHASEIAGRLRAAVARQRAGDEDHPGQRGLFPVAVDQPGRPGHRGQLVPRERARRRTQWARRAADGALREVRRARQQPRFVHAQRRRIARHPADVA
jgi:hypothetical protein